jgi:hypothetical protein
MEPSQPAVKQKPWYLKKSILLFVGGLVLGIILTVIGNTLLNNRGSQDRIACHKPTTQNTQSEYCVYMKRNNLVVGPDGSRGLFYTVPYERDQVSVSWDNDTDALTVTMPSTKLIIQATEYTSSR